MTPFTYGGWPGAKLCTGEPPDTVNPFITWGQIWLAETLIKKALKDGRKFFQIDNAFWQAARGGRIGYYRLMYRRPDPVFITDEALRRSRRMQLEFKPWRKTGTHVLVCEPGHDFGRPFGFHCKDWLGKALPKIKALTDRPIVVRGRFSDVPLKKDFHDAWAVVTHSSNVAVDAVLSGLPVFVAPTSSASPVGNNNISQLETPNMPDRQDWWDSLMCQQFTIDEFASGTAYHYLSAVAKQVEDSKSFWRSV